MLVLRITLSIWWTICANAGLTIPKEFAENFDKAAVGDDFFGNNFSPGDEAVEFAPEPCSSNGQGRKPWIKLCFDGIGSLANLSNLIGVDHRFLKPRITRLNFRFGLRNFVGGGVPDERVVAEFPGHDGVSGTAKAAAEAKIVLVLKRKRDKLAANFSVGVGENPTEETVGEVESELVEAMAKHGIGHGVGHDEGEAVAFAQVSRRGADDFATNFSGIACGNADETLAVFLAEVLVEGGAGDACASVGLDDIDCRRGGLPLNNEGMDKGEACFKMFEVFNTVADEIVLAGNEATIARLEGLSPGRLDGKDVHACLFRPLQHGVAGNGR